MRYSSADVGVVVREKLNEMKIKANVLAQWAALYVYVCKGSPVTLWSEFPNFVQKLSGLFLVI